MSRVKISKEELFDNDLPPLCMICGVKKATSQVPHTARYVGFPANLFGLLGKYLLASTKWSMKVMVCDSCKPGFMAERVFSDLWKTAHLMGLLGIGYYLATDPAGMPENLKIPGGLLVAALFLEVIHFWTLGRNKSVRCLGIERHFVSFEFPNGQWGVAYATHKRESEIEKNRKRPTSLNPPSTTTTPPVAPAAAPTPPVTPPQFTPDPSPIASPTLPPATDPANAPSLDDFFNEPPPPGAPLVSNDVPNPAAPAGPVITHASEDLNFIAFEGSELAQIPDELPDLFKVIKLGDTDLLEDALRKGADVNELLPNGMNGLHVAALAGVMQVADLLIRCGLSPNSEMASGLTPLHLAVQSNSQNLVGLMLAKKGNPNHANAQGRTPLHWVVAVEDTRLEPKARLQIAKMLRRAGADITLPDHEGKTPADLARFTGDTMLISSLV